MGEVVENVGTGRSTFTTGVEQSSETPHAVLGSTSVISYDREFDHNGEFVLTARVGANAGNLYKHSGKVKISDNTVYIQADDLDFIYYLLIKYNLKQLSFGTGQPLVKASELKNLKLKFPKNKEEQKEIGGFLKKIDETITLHQRKLDLLKQLKKAYLQKMFPKNGETVPELRFVNFENEWRLRKLEDISDKVIEKNKDNEFLETLTNSAEYGIINQREFFDKDISNEKNLYGYYIVREDDFVYNPRVSNYAPVGPIKRNKLGRVGVMSPLYYVFRLHDIDKTFLEYYFDTTEWHKFMKLNGDSGARADRFAIKDSIFKTMPIPYPSIKEQKVIGSFFMHFDSTITHYQTKLDQLKKIKSAFLQKMFI